MVFEHVHYTDLGYGNGVEVRALIDNCAYKETSIRATHDGNFADRCVVLINHIFSSRNEVVEYVLFLHFGAGEVPIFAIFATTTEVDNGVDTTIFDEWDARSRE